MVDQPADFAARKQQRAAREAEQSKYSQEAKGQVQNVLLGAHEMLRGLIENNLISDAYRGTYAAKLGTLSITRACQALTEAQLHLAQAADWESELASEGLQ